MHTALQPPGTAHSWRSPQGDFSPHALGKDFEVAEKPSPLGNKYKGQMGEPLPTCQGQGRLHQIARLYTGFGMLIFADLEVLYPS